MHCDLLTVFPELIQAVGSQSMMKRAQEKGLLTIRTHNLRDYTVDPHR
jgi:tRNA (guanine37-N1)-methyltransferase